MSKLMQIIFVVCIAVALSNAEAPSRYRFARFQQQHPRQRTFARQEEAPVAVTPYPTARELKPEIPFEETGNTAPDGPTPFGSPSAPGGPGAPGQFPGSAPGPFPASAPGQFPEAAPGQFPEPAPGQIPEQIPEAFPGSLPEDDLTPIDLPEDVVPPSQLPRQPDEIYGPPETDDFPVDVEAPAIADEEEQAQAAEEEAIASGRLVFGQRIGARNTAAFRAQPAKLRAAPKAVKSARQTKARFQRQLRQAQLIQQQQQLQQPLFYYMPTVF